MFSKKGRQQSLNQAWSLANPLICCARHPPRNWSKDVVSIYCPVIFRQKLRSKKHWIGFLFFRILLFISIDVFSKWFVPVWSSKLAAWDGCTCLFSSMRLEQLFEKKRPRPHLHGDFAARRRIAGPITCCPMQCTGLASPPARTKKQFMGKNGWYWFIFTTNHLWFTR